MQFPEYLDRHYRPEPGAAVRIAIVIRDFYAECSITDQFDWQPDRIRGFLDRHYPVGLWDGTATVGNLRGQGSIVISDRSLNVFAGDLLPRDLRPDEFPIRQGDNPFRGIRTLTRNQMSAMGWNRV